LADRRITICKYFSSPRLSNRRNFEDCR